MKKLKVTEEVKQESNYYADQLAKIGKSEYAPTIVVNHETGKTNHLSLNDDSATQLVKWLNDRYKVDYSKIIVK